MVVVLVVDAVKLITIEPVTVHPVTGSVPVTPYVTTAVVKLDTPIGLAVPKNEPFCVQTVFRRLTDNAVNGLLQSILVPALELIVVVAGAVGPLVVKLTVTGVVQVPLPVTTIE